MLYMYMYMYMYMYWRGHGREPFRNRSPDRAHRRQPSTMSRVRWRSLAARASHEFAHTVSGRLHADATARPLRSWVVVGHGDFIKSAVPALRSAGMAVDALSVVPSSRYGRARLVAQDEQDVLCAALNVSEGCSMEALLKSGVEDGQSVLIGSRPSSKLLVELSSALHQQGRTVVLEEGSTAEDARDPLFNPPRFAAVAADC